MIQTSCWVHPESLKSFLPNKIVWSTVVQLLGKGAHMVLGAYTLHVVTTAMGTEQYGLYGKIAEFALFFSTTANLGIFGNTVRKMAEHPHDGKLFANALVLRVVTALAFFATGLAYAWIWIPDEAYLLGLVFFMSSLLLDYITSVCDGMLQANYKMGRATAALVLGRVVNLLVILFLVRSGFNAAPLFFLGPLVGAVFTASLSLTFVRLQMPFHWQADREHLRVLFFSSLPFGIINIFNNLYFRFLPSFFMNKVLSEAWYGSYTLSLHMASFASLISTLLMFSSLPTLKQAIQHKDLGQVRRLLHKIKKSLFFLGLLMIFSGSLLAPYAVSLLSGHSFLIPELWFMLPLLLVLAAVSYFYDVALITLFAFEQDLWFLKKEGLTLLLGGSLLLISYHLPTVSLQTLGILLSAIAAETFITMLGLSKLRKLLHVS